MGTSQRGLGDVPGSISYEVLKRAGFRRDLCGVHADRALEVDHRARIGFDAEYDRMEKDENYDRLETAETMPKETHDRSISTTSGASAGGHTFTPEPLADENDFPRTEANNRLSRFGKPTVNDKEGMVLGVGLSLEFSNGVIAIVQGARKALLTESTVLLIGTSGDQRLSWIRSLAAAVARLLQNGGS